MFKTKEEIYNAVVLAIIERFDKPKDSLVLEARLVEDLNLDSLDKVDLLCELEDMYGEELITDENEEDEQSFKGTETIQDIVDLTYKIINKKE